MTMWHRRCAKIILYYSRQNLFQRSLAVPMPRHLKLDVWSWLLTSFMYLSVGLILRISEATLMVFVAGHEPVDLGSAQNTQLLERFFARTELLALAGVDSLVLVGQKRDLGKIKSSSVAVRHFCFRPVRARSCRTVSSSPHWKLVSSGLRQQCCPCSWGLLQMI